MSDRLKSFRDYMEKFDAAAAPRSAIERSLYVSPVGRSIADEVAGLLELRPASSYLVVGGIGSGKTTQLLMAALRLEQRRDMHTLFIDVSAEHDLGKLVPGVLVVLVGLKLAALLEGAADAAIGAAKDHFIGRARGRTYFTRRHDEDEPPDDGYPEDEDPGEIVSVPGILSPPPQPQVPDLLWQDHAQLGVLAEALRKRTPHVSVLVDSLDRLTIMEDFERIVLNDVSVLRSLGIGVALVGPLQLLYGTWRPIANHFDKLFPVHWADPADTGGRDFLLRVLRARAPGHLLTEEAETSLVEVSGGMLRALIGLARDSGEEAYLSGSDRITAQHVAAAADAFGRTLLLGLVGDEISDLQQVRTQGSFIPTSERQVALLTTGRVLQYGGGGARYAVHPTLRPLLEQLANQP